MRSSDLTALSCLVYRWILSFCGVLGHHAAHLPLGGVIRVELQLLVGILQRHVITDLTFAGCLVQVGDPVSLVLCSDGRQKSGRQLGRENVANRGGSRFAVGTVVTGAIFGPGDRQTK